MCAITGIKLRSDRISTQEARRLCVAMADRMKHRGPDDDGFFEDPNRGVFLAQRRLSIIDLSPAGRQPLFNEERNVAVLVNGEIYNHKGLRSALLSRGHRFSSQSDSEVLVHLFEEKGAGAWKDLRGMFAAAVYDSRTGDLHLTRDPLGIKPLYLFETPDFFAFASEIRAFDVFEGSQDSDFSGLIDFLMLGSVPSPRTHRRGVRALRPGENIRITSQGLAAQGGPSIPSWCNDAARSARPEIGPLRECIRDSVAKHLVSDVPIGIFLSGGIDSGALAGVASEISKSAVHTIAVTVPGHELDESAYARETAETYGTHHVEVPLDQASFEKDIDTFFDHLDLPSIDGLNTFVVSKAARKAGLTVALSGVGGDELFGGYSSFEWIPKVQRIHGVASLLGRPGRRAAAALLEFWRDNSSGLRVAEVLRSSTVDIRSSYLAARGILVGHSLESVLTPDLRQYAREAQVRYYDETSWATRGTLPSALAIGGLELTRYMCSQLLRDTDVMSMAHSLEVRTPLVDVEVIRAALPFLVHKISGDGFPKWALRQALTKPLPARVVQRPKQGFVFPWQEWLRGKVLMDFETRLANPKPWAQVLNPKALRWWRDAYVSGWAHWSCFWTLYVAMRFLDRRFSK